MRNLLLLMAGSLALLSLGTACASGAATATQPGPAPITVANVQAVTSTPAPSPTPFDETVATVPPISDPVSGAALFVERQCAMCHGDDAVGGMGPALNNNDFAQRFPDDAEITQVVREAPTGMPSYDIDRLTEQQMGDVVAYLRSLEEP